LLLLVVVLAVGHRLEWQWQGLVAVLGAYCRAHWQLRQEQIIC
jgi:hypothetical protein